MMEPNMESKIAIIVPVYNAERYITRCVKSLLGQTYRNLEVILVNDASPDGSLAICQGFAAQDERVRVVDFPQNRGVMRARFAGLEVASAQWVMFVDADDYLPLDAVKRMQRVQWKTNSDIVCGRDLRVFDNRGWIKKAGKPIRINGQKMIVASGPEVMERYFSTFWGTGLFPTGLSRKLYRKSLFVPSLFPADIYAMRFGEDTMTNMFLFPQVERLALIDEFVYYYRYGGATSAYAPNFYADAKTQYRLRGGMMAKYGREELLPLAKKEAVNALFLQLVKMYQAGKGDDETRALLEEEIRSGFVNEITQGLERQGWNFLNLLKAGNVDGLLAACQREGKRRRKWQRIYHSLHGLLQYI
ncbi:MAG: glycosyltransferase [Mediterranea sp.]|jgi:glycosyltransferase involved in cell wall biosynthesis|nr:glycosyltransferase [Mediterranea sp.]